MDVFVFDLDFTIWNAGDTWCSETDPPYSMKEGRLVDQTGRWIRLYEEVPAVLEQLSRKNKTLAIASRTLEPEYARELIDIFGIGKYFHIREIYPGSKITHLSQILEKTGSPPDKVVFFDDEERNIEETSSLGISGVLVSGGVDLATVSAFMD